jgi:hypothetical protein
VTRSPLSTPLRRATWVAISLAVLIACARLSHHDDESGVAHSQTPGKLSDFSSQPFGGSPSNAAEPFLYATDPVPPAPDGTPSVFHVRDIGKAGKPRLTLAMRSSILGVSRKLRPKFRPHLAFLFSGHYGRQFLVVFLDGYPQFPALNVCARGASRSCTRVCPLYVHPHSRRVVPSTMPTCVDRTNIRSHQRFDRMNLTEQSDHP